MTETPPLLLNNHYSIILFKVLSVSGYTVLSLGKDNVYIKVSKGDFNLFLNGNMLTTVIFTATDHKVVDSLEFSLVTCFATCILIANSGSVHTIYTLPCRNSWTSGVRRTRCNSSQHYFIMDTAIN